MSDIKKGDMVTVVGVVDEVCLAGVGECLVVFRHGGKGWFVPSKLTVIDPEPNSEPVYRVEYADDQLHLINTTSGEHVSEIALSFPVKVQAQINAWLNYCLFSGGVDADKLRKLAAVPRELGTMELGQIQDDPIFAVATRHASGWCAKIGISRFAPEAWQAVMGDGQFLTESQAHVYFPEIEGPYVEMPPE